MEAKLNKARQHFSNEVSLKVGADFQLIPLKDACKWTRNVYPYMQFYFIEKKTKMHFMRFLWLGVKIPSAMTDVGMVQFTTTLA